MAKVKRCRPSRLLLYFAIFSSFANCVFIGAVIFSFRSQNKKFSELLSKVPACGISSGKPKVASTTNVLSSLPTLQRFQQSPSIGRSCPYAVVRQPREGESLVQVITHEGEMRWVRYSELPSAWRTSKSR